MQKIIRERYENGQLVAREIEVTGVRWGKAGKLVIHGIIAASLATLALLAIQDALLLRSQLTLEGTANTHDFSCPAPEESRT